jgi:uncharacterized protein (TIGR03086 family)
MSEASERYLGLAEQFGARVEAAPDDAFGRPAPCEGWTGRDVVAHVLESMRRITAAIKEGDADKAQKLGPDEDPKAAWRSSFAEVKDALASPEAATATMPGPMGDAPIDMMVGRILASDVLVHTWDLARAVGGDEHLDQDAVAHAFEGLKPMDAMLRRPGVFGPKVEPPEGADLQTQVLAFVGRTA